MKKLVRRCSTLFILAAVILALSRGAMQLAVRAIDPIDEIEQEKNQLQHLLDLSAAATTPLEGAVADLQARIKKAQADIAVAQAQTQDLAKTIGQREIDLASKYKIFAERVAAQYKRRAYESPFTTFLTSSDAINLARTLTYRASVESYDDQTIHQIGTDIQGLEKEKQNLETTQKRLAGLSADLDRQTAFFKKEIKGAKDYQAQLAGQIASLTAKQQEIINARSGSFITSVGDVPPADDFNASIAYKPQAPADSFAVFSFGAYTHRNGMSQYGAKARAESGQSVEDILHAYYPNATIKKDYGEMGSINVKGYGSMSFEDAYLQGIGEMPRTWNVNALKAQAIAARSFAIAYTGNGARSICTNESCQVYTGSKKGGDWETAVNDTKHWVLVDSSGQAISTQYASTDGGYTNSAGWDTTDHSNSGDWSTRAWESKARSPWFYKAWYTQGYSVDSGKCGRNHPWLSQEEMSDIINAYLVRKNAGGADVNRIQPVTINQCHVGGSGGNPYSMSELRDWAEKSGGAVTHINSVSVSNSSSAQTSNVHFDTNRGGIDIPGNEFKTTFNLRAPGYMSIPQTNFAFFNVEHKT